MGIQTNGILICLFSLSWSSTQKGTNDLDSRPEALKKLVATGGVGQFEIPIQDIQSYK